MGYAFGRAPTEAGVLLLFAAHPTAQSCYVMTAQTLVSMATLTVWTTVIVRILAAS